MGSNPILFISKATIMKTFKTGAIEWTVRITTATIERVKDLVEIDLYQFGTGGDSAKQMFTSLSTDLAQIGKVLWAICKPQAQAAGLTVETFRDLFGGAEVLAGRDAMLEEVASFFDQFSQTTANSLAVAKVKEIGELAGKILDQTAAKFPSASQLLTRSADTSGSAPAGSALTLAPTHSPSS